MTEGRIVEVAAAVIQRPDGSFLLGQRPEGKVYAGYWEFPGGKVEPGERPADGLARELDEELGIEVRLAYPWITRRYTYPHATVNLRFFRVVDFAGEPHGREGQRFAWQRIEAIDVGPLLPANGPILAALALPTIYAITNAAELGELVFLQRLGARAARNPLLIQVREPQMDAAQLASFAMAVRGHVAARGARVLLNADVELAKRLGLDGVHLKSTQLASLGVRPELPLVGASCHDERELAMAQALGADFVVLGPVLPTLSHPGASALGWDRFASMIEGCPLPVYALGGLAPADLERAWTAGAHGIAMQRAAW
jgi:8-oxo-dGTP diphosphatase